MAHTPLAVFTLQTSTAGITSLVPARHNPGPPPPSAPSLSFGERRRRREEDSHSALGVIARPARSSSRPSQGSATGHSGASQPQHGPTAGAILTTNSRGQWGMTAKHRVISTKLIDRSPRSLDWIVSHREFCKIRRAESAKNIIECAKHWAKSVRNT